MTSFQQAAAAVAGLLIAIVIYWWYTRKNERVLPEETPTQEAERVARASVQEIERIEATSVPQLTPEQEDKKQRRDALRLRLERLFSKIDDEDDDKPYGQLSPAQSGVHADAILKAACEIYLAGIHLKLWDDKRIIDTNPLESQAIRAEISGLLFVGLRRAVTSQLCDALRLRGVEEDFAEEAFQNYGEANCAVTKVEEYAEYQEAQYIE